ncbi:DUF4012 domain-containing protein [Streptosporangium sp. NPDC048047]|uniref:DUF4012 domain-containing protein n=1 Tax=Streptosporangium sp. NPDC048047 TaxID=3155748 RepID=UPI003424AA54
MRGRPALDAGYGPRASDTYPAARRLTRYGRRRRRRRAALLGLLVLAGAVVPAGGWSAHLALGVRDHLEAARDALLRLRAAAASGNPLLMAAPLAEARLHAAEARRLTDGFDWALVAHAPLVGGGATTVRGIAHAVAEATEALTGVQRTGARLLTAEVLRGEPGRLLRALGAAAPALDAAAARLARAEAVLAATPADTGSGQVDLARGTALREIGRLRGWTGGAATAAALLPPMLGADGPRRYFLAFQTNAEARGTGGLVGAYGILRAGRGAIEVDRLSAENGIGSPTPVAHHGPAFKRLYGPYATKMLSVSNLSPHFPYAAETWTGLWERRTGRRLDGAVAVDPVGLSYLLGLIGPVTLPGGEAVTAGNVVDLTERRAYARYPDVAERKRFLIDIAAAVARRLPSALTDPVRLLPVMARMAQEHRVQAWSRHDAEQRRLAETPAGGVLPRRPGPFAALVVNNSAGTKLDYYLERSVDYRLGSCVNGLRPSSVRIRLTNDVPRAELPPYVTSRLDAPRRDRTPGSNLSWVSLYAAPGAKITDVRLDGERVPVATNEERSHPVYSVRVPFAPRQTRMLEFGLAEPASAEPPVVPVQPLVRPQRTTVAGDWRGCA